MDPATFSSLPSSTNAVESLHRVSKGKHPDVLKVALMTTYKVDMACTLEHMAASKHIPTSRQWRSQHIADARAQHGYTVFVYELLYVKCRSILGRGGIPAWNFTASQVGF